MSVDLRPYQKEAVERVRESFRFGARAPLLVAPTGAGKTVMFSYITQAAAARGNRVMILAHRTELLDQISGSLTRFGVAHGMVAAGRTPDWGLPVQVAGVHTLIRRLDKVEPPNLLVVDEAHHAAAGSWKLIVNAYPEARILGVTATPERLDGKGLKDVFDDLIRGPEVSSLIESGYLSRPIYYAPSVADLDGVRTTGGDYNRKDLGQVMMDSTVTGNAVEHYARLCSGVPAIAFCASIQHAERVAEEFNRAGFRWGTIDGEMTPAERRGAVEGLASGALHGLSSCDIVSEGFDLPCVTAAILLRPTKSLSLYLQQVGRALRPHPGKTNAIILDHAGNVLKHGLAEQVREWSLEGAKARKARETGENENRQCPSCYCVHEKTEPECPACGFVYGGNRSSGPTFVPGELVELSSADRAAMMAQPKNPRAAEQARARTLEDLVELGFQRGYKNPRQWATYVYRYRQQKRYA